MLVAGAVVVVVATKILGGLGADWRPSHFDEWRSLALAQRFVESGALVAEEPIGSPNGLARDISDRNRSLGFVALVGAWIKVATKPIAHFKALALGFVLLYLAGVYLLCRAVGVRPWATLPAVLGLGALPTDAMLLGPALAVPSSLSLGLLCFALVAHLRLSNRLPTSGTTRTGLWWATLIGLAATLAIVYPLTLIVFAGLVAIDGLARPSLRRTRYGRWLGTLGGLGIVLFLLGEWRGDFSSTADHFANLFVLDQTWHLVSFYVYRLDYMVLAPLLLLAFVGAGVSLFEDLPKDAERDRLWLAAAFLGPVVAVLVYQDLGVGLVVPYQRVGLFLGFGALLCAAVAVERMLVAMEARSYPGWFAAIVIGVSSFSIVFSPRPAPPYEGPLSVLRPEPILEAVAHKIAQKFSPPTRFFAAPRDSLYLEALTGLRASPVSLDALLTGFAPPPIDCEAGWEIIVGQHDCPNYVLAFRVDDFPVYEKRHVDDSRDQSPP